MQVYRLKKRSSSRFISNLEIKTTNLWRLSKINPSVLNKSKYKECVQQIRKAKFIQLAICEKPIIMPQNLGTLYKHTYSRLTHKVGIAPLLNQDGELV